MTSNSFQFCPHCGTPYTQLAWPRTCTHCKTLQAPVTPVIVVPLVCVFLEKGGEGVLAVEHHLSTGREHSLELESMLSVLQNAHQPWTLPFGVMYPQESVEMASARIVQDQTGLDMDPHTFIPKFSKLSFSGAPLLFCRGPNIPESLLEQVAPPVMIREVSAISEPSLLAHPLHAAAAQKFLNRRHHSMRVSKLFPSHVN